MPLGSSRHCGNSSRGARDDVDVILLTTSGDIFVLFSWILLDTEFVEISMFQKVMINIQDQSHIKNHTKKS